MEHGILESKLRIYVLKLMNSDIERFIFPWIRYSLLKYGQRLINNLNNYPSTFNRFYRSKMFNGDI